MEEKERFEFIDFEDKIELIDTKNKKALDSADKIKDTLNAQAKEIASLRHKLEIAELATQLACKELHCELENPDNELYTKSSDECADYFKTRSKEILENE